MTKIYNYIQSKLYPRKQRAGNSKYIKGIGNQFAMIQELWIPCYTYRNDHLEFAQTRKLNKYLKKQERRVERAFEKDSIRAYAIWEVLLQRSNALNYVALHKSIREWYWKYPKWVIIRALNESRNKLRNWQIDWETYRVYIPKPNGKERPLGVPALSTRINLWKLNYILKKSMESQKGEWQHGFRKEKSTITAWLDVIGKLREYNYIYEFDLKSCFNRISYSELRKEMLDLGIPEPWCTWIEHLVKGYPKGEIKLGDPEVNVDIKQLYKDTGKSKVVKTGLPQGWSISPVLANIVINKAFSKLLFLSKVIYADDGLLFFRKPKDEEFLSKKVWAEVFKFGMFKQEAKSGFIGSTFTFLGVTCNRSEGYLELQREKDGPLIKTYFNDSNLREYLKLHYLRNPRYRKVTENKWDWKINPYAAIWIDMSWKTYFINILKLLMGNQSMKRYKWYVVDYIQSSSICIAKFIVDDQNRKVPKRWKHSERMKDIIDYTNSSYKLRAHLCRRMEDHRVRYPKGAITLDSPMIEKVDESVLSNVLPEMVHVRTLQGYNTWWPKITN